MEKKLWKLYLADCKWFKVQDLWKDLLSNLVDHLAEGIHKVKCTSCNTCCRKYTNAKDDLIECKRLCCNKN